MRVLALLILMSVSAIPTFGTAFVPNQLIVKVAVPLTQKTPAVFSELPPYRAEAIALVKSHAQSQNLIYRLFFNSEIDVPQIVAQLKESPEILWAKPNYVIRMEQTGQTDPVSVSQNYLAQLNLPEAWQISSGNSDVFVAVIDTGIYFDHDDLKNKIWNNPGEIPSNNIDDDNNGKIDDWRGWDFVTSGPGLLQRLSYEDYTTEDGDPTDRVGHGTEVSGVISAEHNNDKGIKGVGGNTKIMPLRAGYAVHTSGGVDGEFDTAGLYNAIVYATDNGAKIINLSLGGVGDERCLEFCLDDAVEYAISNNVLVVAAAGNGSPGINIEDNDFIPASLPGVFTVSSVSSQNRFSSFSNYGENVAVAAPGEAILTTGYVAENGTDPLPNGYVFATGTSLATPIVSGIAALILGKYPSANIKNALMATTQGYTGAHSPQTGYGVVDALSALAYFDASPPAISHIPLTGATAEQAITVSATISDNLSDVLPPRGRVKYREITESTISDWKYSSMTRSGTSFTGYITTTQNVQKIDYTIEANDSNPSNSVVVPASGVYQITLSDLSGPSISSAIQDHDFVEVGNSISVTINDYSGIATNSIIVRVNDEIIQNGVTFAAGRLSIPIPDSIATSSVTVRITVQDTKGNPKEFTLILNSTLSNTTLTLNGPNGGNTILNYPNPFSPQIQSTKIAFQSSRNGKVEISIWSRYFEKVTQISESIFAGYNEIVWTGKSDDGSVVPSGVYFAVITVTSEDGQQKTKRIKIAVK